MRVTKFESGGNTNLHKERMLDSNRCQIPKEETLL